ncbi:hypothetical protein [Streptomyces sp. NPDC089919]|uniref:hypothetical protein n=1 Tax=Streptomyces sp. NPDC089919 TaxID=3155188 RepID=UPI00341ED928
MAGDDRPAAATARAGRARAERAGLPARFAIPAGKAMAWAALPTAAVLGMTVTPGLAQADEDVPVVPGPCVQRPAGPGDSGLLCGAKAPAADGIPLLPDQPFLLTCSKLSMAGLDYAGVVTVRTAGGGTKKVMKFTASGIAIKNMHQTVVEGGRTMHVTARRGATATIGGGRITMYTDELKGDLFGTFRVTYTPSSPPPLNVSSVYFTDVKVKQTAQFGGTLNVPGLKLWSD